MKDTSRLRILWAGKTGDANAWYHIQPFVGAPGIEAVTVVRNGPPRRPITSTKVRWRCFGRGALAAEAVRFVRAIRAELRAERYDAVVAYGAYPWGFLAWTALGRSKIPFCIGLIGTDFNQHAKRGVLAPVFRIMLRRAACVFVPGERMRRDVIAVTGAEVDVRIISHSVPDEMIRPIDSETTPALRLVTIAALTTNKRTIDIVRAIRRLVADGHDCQLRIVGSGPEMTRIEEYVRAERLNRVVSIVGAVADVRPHLEWGTVYVQASLQEGLSLALLEAMAMGLVPVVTEAGCESDIIVDGVNGLFVPMCEPDAIANAAVRLLSPAVFHGLREGVRDTQKKLGRWVAADEADRALAHVVHHK